MGHKRKKKVNSEVKALGLSKKKKLLSIDKGRQ